LVIELKEMKQALLIFVKNPIKGKVKTRLAANIGDISALEIYVKLLKHTQKCTHLLNADKTVFYSDFIENDERWSSDVYYKKVQKGNSLGERMENAFEYAFSQGSERVVIIGSDCFEISSEIIDNAFAQLEHCDVVLGPAFDGGYYLLGTKSLIKELFWDISWSTDQVLIQTLTKCATLGLKTITLEELSDIDNEADLERTGYKFKRQYND
jgi:rSAM/selenodomain-associated transferase 1